MTVTNAISGETLISVREMAASADTQRKQNAQIPVEDRPLLVSPSSSTDRMVDVSIVDPTMQPSTIRASTTLPRTFDGISDGIDGYQVRKRPPDTQGAPGLTQYVQWVNVDIGIYNKATGALETPIFPGNMLFANLGGICAVSNDGDPITVWDQLANRWVLSQFAVTGVTTTSGTFYTECVAVSKTADATGEYWLYAFEYGNINFNDFPKMGLWPDAYYISFNIFPDDQSPQFSKVCAYDRSRMLEGLDATQVCFDWANSDQGANHSFSFLPSDLDGYELPPAGSPNYFVTFPSYAVPTTVLQIWKFFVNFVNPELSTFSSVPDLVEVTPFFRPFDNAIPQPDTAQRLDSVGDRLNHRFPYRNRRGKETLLVSHSIIVEGIVTVRWYAIRVKRGVFSLEQEGTLDQSDGIYRWLPSIAMDKDGNIAIGYSASNSTLFPSIRHTARRFKDSANTMQVETIIASGTGSQRQGSRWGDYSSMTMDPVDDCTFWYTNQYQKQFVFLWQTSITSFVFDSCLKKKKGYGLRGYGQQNGHHNQRHRVNHGQKGGYSKKGRGMNRGQKGGYGGYGKKHQQQQQQYFQPQQQQQYFQPQQQQQQYFQPQQKKGGYGGYGKQRGYQREQANYESEQYRYEGHGGHEQNYYEPATDHEQYGYDREHKRSY